MIIENKFQVNWSIKDPVYSYQGVIELTQEEILNFNPADYVDRQKEEYDAWLITIKSMENNE